MTSVQLIIFCALVAAVSPRNGVKLQRQMQKRSVRWMGLGRSRLLSFKKTVTVVGYTFAHTGGGWLDASRVPADEVGQSRWHFVQRQKMRHGQQVWSPTDRLRWHVRHRPSNKTLYTVLRSFPLSIIRPFNPAYAKFQRRNEMVSVKVRVSVDVGRNVLIIGREKPMNTWPGTKPISQWTKIFESDDTDSTSVNKIVSRDVCVGSAYHVRLWPRHRSVWIFVWNFSCFLRKFIVMDHSWSTWTQGGGVGGTWLLSTSLVFRPRPPL